MVCNFEFSIKCPRHGENILSPQNVPRLETFPSCYFFSLAVKVVESCIYCTLTSELFHVDSPKELSLGLGLGVFVTLASSLGLLFIFTLLLSPSLWDWASRLMPLSTYHTHSRLWNVISSSIWRLPLNSGGLTLVFLLGLFTRLNIAFGSRPLSGTPSTSWATSFQMAWSGLSKWKLTPWSRMPTDLLINLRRSSCRTLSHFLTSFSVGALKPSGGRSRRRATKNSVSLR